MVREFVPEMRSDKKDAEIARLREQVRVLRDALKDHYAAACGMPKSCGHEYQCICTGDKARAALAATEEK